MSGTKGMAQKPILPQNQKIPENALSLPLAAWADSDNVPLQHASELFEPSKDS